MDIGIKEESRSKVSKSLQKVLANQHVLYQKFRNFHWNLKGEHFYSLHNFFEESYGVISEDIDEIAERIQTLGFNAKATMAEYLELSDIKESPGEYPLYKQMVETLLADSEKMIRVLRDAANVADDEDDVGTEDLLIGVLQHHEKQAWMLRSTLA